MNAETAARHLSRLAEDAVTPYRDGSVRVGGPYECFACRASSADQWLDQLFDSRADGNVHWACHDVIACAHRSVLAATLAGGAA